jgi:hypothetical protein
MALLWTRVATSPGNIESHRNGDIEAASSR